MTEETSVAEGLLHRVRYHERGYTEVEGAIAKALIGDPSRALHESIETFAARVGVSSGSVVRFARLMGFSGFREFKLGLAAGSAPEEPTVATIGAAEATLEAQARAIQFAARTLDSAAFQIAAEVLASARSIDIVGSGAASATARAAEFQLTIAGFICRRLGDGGEAAAAASFLGPRGVLLAISHSGRTRTTVDAAHRARASGASVVTVCSARTSPLVQSSTHFLVVEAAQTRYAEDELPFRAAHLAIVQSLVRAAIDSTTAEEQASRRAAWAAARFDLRYGEPAHVKRSSNDPRTLTGR